MLGSRNLDCRDECFWNTGGYVYSVSVKYGLGGDRIGSKP